METKIGDCVKCGKGSKMIVTSNSTFLSSIISRTFNIGNETSATSKLDKAIEKVKAIKEEDPQADIAINVSISKTPLIKGNLSGIKSQTEELQESIHVIDTLNASFSNIQSELDKVQQHIQFIQKSSENGLLQEDLNQAIDNIITSLDTINKTNEDTLKQLHLEESIIADPFNLKVGPNQQDYIDINSILQPITTEELKLNTTKLDITDEKSLNQFVKAVEQASDKLSEKIHITNEAKTLINSNLDQFVLSGNISNIEKLKSDITASLQSTPTESVTTQINNIEADRAISLLSNKSGQEFPPSLESVLTEARTPTTSIQQTSRQETPAIHLGSEDFPPSLESVLSSLQTTHTEQTKTEMLSPTNDDIAIPPDINRNIAKARGTDEFPPTTEKALEDFHNQNGNILPSKTQSFLDISSSIAFAV